MDDLYGAAVLPTRVERAERTRKPLSLHRLAEPEEGEVCRHFRSVIEAALGQFRIIQVSYGASFILWVVDEAGELWIALEEMVGRHERLPLPRMERVSFPPGYEKLGHPALVGASRARIGGELYWDGSGADAGDAQGQWVLNNKSGRYGIRVDITAAHLDNVAQRFADLGIEVVTDYIPAQL